MTASAHAVPTRRASAHRRAVSGEISTLTKELQTHLGQALLAVIVEAQPRTVARWIAGETQPPAATEQLLRDVSQIFEVITAVDTPKVARAWFMGMNPQLEDNSPAEALAQRTPASTRTVMAAARSYAAGSGA